MDATANPHLALAAIVTAGLLGLRRQGELPRPVEGDPGELSREVMHPCDVLLCHVTVVS